MLIGYARVSTDDQDTATQVAALKAARCERIYREKAFGGTRPGCVSARSSSLPLKRGTEAVHP